MGIKAILFAVSAIAASDAPPDQPKPSTIDFEVRIVDCDGLAWRGSILPRLTFQGYRAGSTAWVADAEALAALIETLQGIEDTEILGAPRIQAAAGTPATFQSWTSRHVVLHAEAVRMASASASASASTSRPIVAPVEDGVRLVLRGQPVAHGLRLALEVEDTRIVAMHQVVTPMNIGTDQAPRVTPVDLRAPEIDRREVAGEWLIPDDHGLVISLGLQSRPRGGDGRTETEVRDRLMILVPSTSSAPAPASVDLAVRPTVADTPPQPPERDVPQEGANAESTPAPPPPNPMSPAVLGANGPAIPPPAPRFAPQAFPPHGFELKPTPWGLVPVFPAPPLPEAAEGDDGRASVPGSMVPSRSLPIALMPDGSPAPPSEDDRVVRDSFESFIEGRAVPTPQMSDDAAPGDPRARQPLEDRLARASGNRTPRPAPAESAADTAVEAAPPPPSAPSSAREDKEEEPNEEPNEQPNEQPKRGFRFRIGFRVGLPWARTEDDRTNAAETEREVKDNGEAPRPSPCPHCGKD